MEGGNDEENIRPRRSTRPSALKLFGIAELSEAFGISLDSDSDSDQEFAPTKGIDSNSSCASTPISDDDENDLDDKSSGEVSPSELGAGKDKESDIPVTSDLTKTDHLLDGIPDFNSQASVPKLRNPICHVCLEGSQVNDIVTCDVCGASAHEGCYGVPDEEVTEEAQSDDSSISTVPWFCDSCKAGVKEPLCELCPNRGGLFKQTINGCWVHVVCCLYINEIEYIEPGILSGVTMDAIPSNKWGAKPCSLCEDEWNSTTGVCISCDAGLCKTYFHVTCAQKAGLLCEVDEESNTSSDQEVPDAYFAHCSTHCDKQLAKRKRKNYQAMELDLSSKARKTQVSDARLAHHLEVAKKNYTDLFIKMKKWYKPEEIKQKKQPRWLHHSPSAFHLLTEKANAFGYTVKCLPQSLRGRSSVVSVGLNIDYVNFFNERNGQIAQLEKQVGAIKPEVEKLQLELKQKEEIKSSKEAEFQSLTKQSNDLMGSMKLLLDKINLVAGKEVISPSRLGIIGESINTVSNSNLDDVVVTARCCSCSSCHDNHLMIRCDTCHNNYHIHCLDPPLSKVPKKTTKFGWQCEDCCFDSEDELKPIEVDKDEPQSKFGRRIGRKRTRNWEQMAVFY